MRGPVCLLSFNHLSEYTWYNIYKNLSIIYEQYLQGLCQSMLSTAKICPTILIISGFIHMGIVPSDCVAWIITVTQKQVSIIKECIVCNCMGNKGQIDNMQPNEHDQIFMCYKFPQALPETPQPEKESQHSYTLFRIFPFALYQRYSALPPARAGQGMPICSCYAEDYVCNHVEPAIARHIRGSRLCKWRIQ
jgi:hypothetical protein